MRILFFYSFFLLISLNLFSQELNDTITLNEVKTLIKPTFDNVENKAQFTWLENKILKVYPVFSEIYIDYYKNLKSVSDSIKNKKIKKIFIKNKTNEFKEKYFNRLKKLTNYEGKILTKLIHRESNSTSFEIIKEYKGSFYAKFINFEAKFANIDLNEKFTPEIVREDKYIEIILQNLFLQKKITDVKSFN